MVYVEYHDYITFSIRYHLLPNHLWDQYSLSNMLRHRMHGCTICSAISLHGVYQYEEKTEEGNVPYYAGKTNSAINIFFYLFCKHNTKKLTWNGLKNVNQLTSNLFCKAMYVCRLSVSLYDHYTNPKGYKYSYMLHNIYRYTSWAGFSHI